VVRRLPGGHRVDRTAHREVPGGLNSFVRILWIIDEWH
jgi:hypothetical protein